jgi:hypothetical protein
MIRAAYRAFYLSEQGMRTRYFATKRELRAFLAECRHAKVKAWEPAHQKLVTVVMPKEEPLWMEITSPKIDDTVYPTPPSWYRAAEAKNLARAKKKGKEKKVLSSVAMVRARIAGLNIGG